MSLPRYQNYKDSQSSLLGMIPTHWSVFRLKSVLSAPLKYGANEAADDDNRSNPRFVRITDIDDNGELRDETFRSIPENLAQDFLLEDGDILLARSGATVGKSFIYRRSWGICCFAGYLINARVSRKIMLPEFAYACLRSSFYWRYISSVQIQATIQNVSAEKYAELLLPGPPIAEQTAICAFLDREATKIDALITEQAKLIALLAEKRQATIVQAVIRGINPNSPLKHSGVAWLGEVPKHWEIYSTKRLFRLVTEPAPDNNDEELLSIYTEIGVRPRKSLEEKGNKATTTDGYWTVRKGDIIVNKLLAWMGAIGLSEYDGVTSPAYDILRKTKPLNPKYYDYLFRCGVMFTEFRRNSRGIMDMRLRLYFEDFGQIHIPYPPEREQSEIIDFLNFETAKLDSLTAEAQHAIELLKERRSALFTAAVTGQIDVRDTVTQPALSVEGIAA